MIKKTITLVAAMMLLIALSLPAAAAANEDLSFDAVFSADTIESQTIVYNEYEVMEQLAAESSGALAKKGFTAEEITAVKNYREIFENHIEELDNLYSDEELLTFGYIDDEVLIIRDFKNLTPTLRNAYSSQLAANLTLSLTAKNALSYTNGVNKIKLNYKFDWTRVPTMKFTDKFGLSWNDANFIIDTAVHSNGIVPIKINYIGMPYTTNITAGLHGNGIMYTIPMTVGVGAASVADNAEGNLSLRYSGSQVNELAVKLDYAHAKLPGGISVSLPAGVVGFTFSPSSVVDCIWNYKIFS